MADKKPSSGEVLRTLAEEIRERGTHPDREEILSRYLDDDQEQEDDQPENRQDNQSDQPKAPESGASRKAGK